MKKVLNHRTFGEIGPMKATLMLVVTILLPGLAAFGQFREDPATSSDPVWEWIEKTKDPDPETRRHAALVLKYMGPVTVPALSRC